MTITDKWATAKLELARLELARRLNEIADVAADRQADIDPVTIYDAGSDTFGMCCSEVCGCGAWPGERHSEDEGSGEPPRDPDGRPLIYVGRWQVEQLPAVQELADAVYSCAGVAQRPTQRGQLADILRKTAARLKERR